MANMFGSTQKKNGAMQDPHPPVASKPPRVDMPAEEHPATREGGNVIGKGTVIEGNIVADGDLVLEGTVRGDVTTKSKLVVSNNAAVEGNILADHAEIAGKVRGTVQATGLLIIRSCSMIDGDVITKNLNVESGSTFNGRFQVGGKVESVAKPADGMSKKDHPAVATKV